MPTFDDLLSYLPDVDPIILIVGGIIAAIVVLFLLRVATGLVVRILSIGCAVIVILAILWFAWQILIPLF